MFLRDQQILMGGYDLTTAMNSVGLVAGREALDQTAFGNQSHIFAPGLKTVKADVAGFFNGDPYDAALFNALGVVNTPFSVLNAANAGSVGYSFKAMEAAYTPFNNKVGELAGFTSSAEATGDLIRGTVMIKNPAVNANGDSTVQHLGAVLSTQKLYAVLHVFSKSGTLPTLDVTVKSDDNSGMSSPTTRGTFSQVTAIGSQWLEVAGAITDDYWEVHYVLGGTTPVFGFAVMLAIQ